MTKQTYDYCALQYLNMWLAKEQTYCKDLASNNIEKQRIGISKAAAHFRVARNLPKKIEQSRGLLRYQPVIEILNEIRKIDLDNVTEVIGEFNNAISKEYERKSALSLATKFLWLKFKSPVRIYDQQARDALKTKDGNYADFNNAFSERYIQDEAKIKEACSNLVNVKPYFIQPSIKSNELNSLISKQWFKERVLDIYLWNEGVKSKKYDNAF